MPECSACPSPAAAAPVTEGSRIGYTPRERGLAPVAEAEARPRLAERHLRSAARKERARGGTMGSPTLEAHDADQLAHGVRRLRELGLLVGIQADLDDLLEAARAEPAGDAHVEVPKAVLALQQGGAREHPLLVVHDRVHHLAH